MVDLHLQQEPFCHRHLSAAAEPEQLPATQHRLSHVGIIASYHQPLMLMSLTRKHATYLLLPEKLVLFCKGKLGGCFRCHGKVRGQVRGQVLFIDSSHWP